MLEKIAESFVLDRKLRPLSHANSLYSKNRQNQKQQFRNLCIRKTKSSQTQKNTLSVGIWQTQSTFEMFDYQNKGIKSKQYKLDAENDVYIADIDRRTARCIITKSCCPNQNVFCGTIQKTNDSFLFSPGTKIQAYKVIKNQAFQPHQLEAGNLIRIGRMKYFIKQIFNGLQTIRKQFNRNQRAKILKIQSLKSGTCKFCLCDQKDTSDILISPCSCKGSCAQVHLTCLRQWLANKVSRKSTSYVQFLNYDNFNCQICQQDLPITIQVDGNFYNMLLENDLSKQPYIIMEGIPNSKSSTKNNLTIKINFKQKNKLVIGRGHETDVRLQDVSISRQHCFIKFQNLKFQLIDNQSKFGTLLKIQNGNKVDLSETKIQIARMTFQIAKTQTKPEKYNQNICF